MFKFLIIKIVFISCCLSSCTRLNMYTNKSKNTVLDSLVFVEKYDPIIKTGDKISLSIWNHDELSVGSIYGIYNSNEVFGKWLMVNYLGNITLPKIGEIKVDNLTMSQLDSVLYDLYSKIIQNPVITIRVLNHQVSVIGQVIKPGNYIIDRNFNTIPQLIAEAGGTDYYAKLTSVKLIRNKKEYDLDLTRINTLDLHKINLINGDVLFFPTKKGKILDKKSPVILASASLITTILLIVSFVGKK